MDKKFALVVSFCFILVMGNLIYMPQTVSDFRKSQKQYIELSEDYQRIQEAYEHQLNNSGPRYTGNPFTTQLWPGQLQAENITGMHWYSYYGGELVNCTDNVLGLVDWRLNWGYPCSPLLSSFSTVEFTSYGSVIIPVSFPVGMSPGIALPMAMGYTYKKYESGTFEWEAKYTNPLSSPEPYNVLVLGMLASSYYMVVVYESPFFTNVAMLFYDPAEDKTKIATSNGTGATEETDLSGIVDFTERQKYKIVWETAAGYPPNGRIRLYINDILRATHVTNIPSGELSFMVVVLAKPDAGGIDCECEIYNFSDGE